METSQPEWREERRDSAGLIKPDTERSSFMSILQVIMNAVRVLARTTATNHWQSTMIVHDKRLPCTDE